MHAQVEVLEAGPAAAVDEELLDTVAGATLISGIAVAKCGWAAGASCVCHRNHAAGSLERLTSLQQAGADDIVLRQLLAPRGLVHLQVA